MDKIDELITELLAAYMGMTVETKTERRFESARAALRAEYERLVKENENLKDLIRGTMEVKE
jgi:hypothetical protein